MCLHLAPLIQTAKCGRRGKKEDKSSPGAPCVSSVLSPPTHVKAQVRVGPGGSKNPLKDFQLCAHTQAPWSFDRQNEREKASKASAAGGLNCP